MLSELHEGNLRYASGKVIHPHSGASWRASLTSGQHPKAVVLGCADSRVPPELIFDEGLGDLFVVRVAGNVADPEDIGSIEYATEHLGVHLVVVLGHLSCGAVNATIEAVNAGTKPEGNLGLIESEIIPAIEDAKSQGGEKGLAERAVHANVKRVEAALRQRSPVLAKLAQEGQLQIVGAVYDLESGLVEFEK